MDIRVQQEDFDLAAEYARLRARGGEVGAVVTFTGLVRELQDGSPLQAMTLEHYPGMTENSLRAIAEEAAARWSLLDLTIVHRVGELSPSEQIVLVGTSSAHRQAAFEACAFIMDYLKTRAPFWKKTRDAAGEHWVEAKDSDEQAALRWESDQGR